ncbi:fructose-bisphosphate aldolase class I [Pyxidicoccus parkwayensis]|jgi:fructose-bisphosphate aldolase, class I|uniref:Fructose-bisphosphate aldolase n=1 Tax=Pyxidicoccus parkwayensis TaxID=2813578 RepID=A0ABX7P4A2_9BACT|nr:class I fructose-bisphosphate aldolase [Pyxidicoccus parkwaysis]QSQ25262.1 fructose-bisphosphate aldolase class I [Pyxidicoccus parkwaysis]
MPTLPTLAETARALVADGKGILAADETVSTITKRLKARGIESTADSRRAYREMLFSAPDIAGLIGGVILQDETIRQDSSTGIPLVDLLAGRGIIPGIKVDAGVRPLAGSSGEVITEGLDGLRERLEEYRDLGARFAKWRAVFTIRDGQPSEWCIRANANALARYAVLCQEQGLVPIVEPEVLMDGAHALERCEEVTGRVLRGVFDELYVARVSLEGMLLKPNMAISGQDAPRKASAREVAEATLRVLMRHVPPAVPGIVFLSGGQDHVQATENLNAINQLEVQKPWKLTFSYGRALQDEALQAWQGRAENVPAGQQLFHHRAWCDSAAALGRYRGDMEGLHSTQMGDTPWQTQ